MGYIHANYLRPGVTAPNPHASKAKAHRPATRKAGVRSTGRGLRVGVVDSFEGSFVGGVEPLDWGFVGPSISIHASISS